ncbi:MAG: sulfatase-like hydrolase/transferase, partial [Acidobacteriota bacterium]|nr:sulfatase-like hydrolase/transferase [Acidobacteriota bacterium]
MSVGLALSLVITLWATGGAVGSIRAAAPRPPNVLLIVADDMGWGDLRLHGNERIDTPVLDRFARESARFDRFFVSPVCAPTRASLLTGDTTCARASRRSRADSRPCGPARSRWPRCCARGYATALTGKWHLGAHYPHTPQAQGFDRFVGFFEGHT